MDVCRAIVTVSTVGYGDVVAANHNERIFIIVVGLVGGIVFAFSLGNITSLIAATQVRHKAVCCRVWHRGRKFAKLFCVLKASCSSVSIRKHFCRNFRQVLFEMRSFCTPVKPEVRIWLAGFGAKIRGQASRN